MRQLSLLILLALVLSFASGCNQYMLAAWSGAKNATVGVVDGIRNIGSESEFDRLSLETRKDQRIDQPHTLQLPSDGLKSLNVVSCYEGQEPASEAQNLLDDMAKITDPLVQATCECRAWGSCTKDLCACEKLCPNNFNIFRRAEYQGLSSMSAPEHSLAFRNGGGGSQHQSTQGYCWGHASVTSKFNRLAFFNPSKAPPYDINSADIEIQNKAIEHYKQAIDQIIENNPTEIAGIENLEELSGHPSLQSYIADHVAKSWADNAMTFQGLKVATSAGPMSEQKNRTLLADIQTRLEANMQPQIVFTKKGDRFKTHTLLIGDSFQNEAGQTILCARDSNTSPESNALCENQIFIDDEGKLIYDSFGWGELGSASIAHNDAPDSLVQMKALHDHCRSQKDCNR